MGHEYDATAEYFDTRAKKARHEEERARFRTVAAKYRELARSQAKERPEASSAPLERRP